MKRTRCIGTFLKLSDSKNNEVKWKTVPWPNKSKYKCNLWTRKKYHLAWYQSIFWRLQHLWWFGAPFVNMSTYTCVDAVIYSMQNVFFIRFIKKILFRSLKKFVIFSEYYKKLNFYLITVNYLNIELVYN